MRDAPVNRGVLYSSKKNMVLMPELTGVYSSLK
jgi:hypothetical protein